MSSSNTGDLRGEAKSRQRVRNHNSKWARGYSAAPGKPCQHTTWGTCADCGARPSTGMSQRSSRAVHAENQGNLTKHTRMARRAIGMDVDDALHGSQSLYATEDRETTDTASEEDEVMYSFDAPTGPVRNSQVLSSAITQAVERFENNETEKIVKEYDLVADGEDEVEFADAEDDFELIDPAHFK